MAGEDHRATCSKCTRHVPFDEAMVEKVFGFKSPGVRFKMCRHCRADSRESYQRHREDRAENQKDWRDRNPERAKEISRESAKRYYEANREACLEYAKEYNRLHCEEINQKAREKITCELCGRVVSKGHKKKHQASRLCEKSRPAEP